MGSKDTQPPHRSRGRLSSYHLLQTLGVGGFGKVYLGEHIHLCSLPWIRDKVNSGARGELH